MGHILPIVILIAVIVILFRCIRVVPQANAWIVESLGKYKETWNAGLHMMHSTQHSKNE